MAYGQDTLPKVTKTLDHLFDYFGQDRVVIIHTEREKCLIMQTLLHCPFDAGFINTDRPLFTVPGLSNCPQHVE